VTWTTLLASHDVQRHRTSKRELDEIRAVIERDLGDARVARVSADRRFATAYNAALQTASMAIASAGYRVTAKAGHHRVTIDAITLSTASAISAWRAASSPTTVQTKHFGGQLQRIPPADSEANKKRI